MAQKKVATEGTHRQILLVGEDEEQSVPELVLVQHALKFLSGLDDTVTVVAVNHEDDTLGVLEIVSPQRTDLVLTTDIPHGELNVLVLNRLNVETCSQSQKARISHRIRLRFAPI
jgi:hypothetical protein